MELDLHVRIARVAGLLVGGDGVDVLGGGRVGKVYAFFAACLNKLFDQEVGTLGAFLRDDTGQGVQPFFGFLGINIRPYILRVRGHGFVSS